MIIDCFLLIVALPDTNFPLFRPLFLPCSFSTAPSLLNTSLHQLHSIHHSLLIINQDQNTEKSTPRLFTHSILCIKTNFNNKSAGTIPRKSSGRNNIKMQFSNALIAAAATYFAVGANAHMKLGTPAPYAFDSLTNAPLAADGSDFPCKQRPDVYGPAKSTATMPIGAKQTLAFIGGATHGGGSCQVSITSDEKPTKDSKFKVIHSIEGGCPSADEGNRGDDADAPLSTDFVYSVPEGFAPGKYTLACRFHPSISSPLS